MKIASFFSGGGGLDMGFTKAGFELAYANDNWEGCWETFEKNHGIKIDKRSIINVKPEEVPEVVEIPEVIENVSIEPNLTIEEIPEVIDLEEAESLQFVTIANKLMGVGDKVIFKIDNAEHSVELTDLNSKGIILRFSSDPFDVELALGEAKIVDLDGDGVFDIKVTFNGINDGRADLTYEKLPKSQLSLIYNKIKENKVYIVQGFYLAISNKGVMI